MDNQYHYSLRVTIACFLCAIVIFSSLVVFPAHALEYTSPAGTVTCDLNGESLAVKVIFCVKMSVFIATEMFLAQTTILMMPIIYTVLLFSLILLGTRIAAGEKDAKKLVMSYLLRFGAVLLIADNMGQNFFPAGIFVGFDAGGNATVDVALDGRGLMPQIFLIMEQMQASVIPALYTTGICDIAATNAVGTPAGGYILPITYTPWQYIDCIFDYIFGFGVDATIASSIFGFISSTLISGSMGAMVFLFGLSIVLSLALFAFRAVYAVLVSYIYVGFLMVLAPLFAGFLMFTITERNFFTWLQNIVAAIILPFMMVAYLAFALPLLDHFIFDESREYSLVNTLGMDEEVTDRYRGAEPICEMKNPTDFEFFKDVQNYDQRLIQDPLTPLQTGSFDWCGLFDFTKVDLGEEQVQELWEIGFSLITIFGVAWLVVEIETRITDLSSKLAAGGYRFVGSVTGSPMLFETQLKQATSSLRSSQGFLGGNNGISNLLTGNRS